MGRTDPPMDAIRRPRVLGRIRTVFGVLGLGFAVAAFFRARDSLDNGVSVSASRLAAAALLGVITVGAAARAWSAILPDPSDRRLRRTYYSALIGKYIPGGVFQAAAQIGLASDAGLRPGDATASYGVSMMASVLAGLVACVGIAPSGAFEPAYRSVAFAGSIASALLVATGGAQAILRRLAEVLDRPAILRSIPSRFQLALSVFWGVCGLAAMGFGYAVILGGFDRSSDAFAIAAAFVGAWLVGYLMVPFPAGIGIREGVLLALLAPTAGAAAVIAASLLHRLVTIVVETLVFGVTELTTRMALR